MSVCVAQHFSIVVAVQEETTFKSDPVSPDMHILPIKSEGLQLNQPIFASEALRASRESLNPSRGNFDIGGTVETELSPYMVRMIKFALGSVTTTGASSPYTHVFKIGTLPSFVFEKGFTDVAAYGNASIFKYNGCKINSMSINFASEGILQASFDVMGAKETTSTTQFDTSPTDLGHDPWDMFECAIEEGGSPIAIVQEASVTLENNLDGSYYVVGGAGERECLPAGIARVSGTVTALFRDMTMYLKAYNFNESSLKFTFTRGTGVGTAGNESMEIFIPELKYAAQSPAVEGPGGVKITFNFDAYYDNSAQGTALQITVKNALASV